MLEQTEKQVKMTPYADTVHTLIETHLSRYPEMQITDVYKLLHQGTIGATHAITNRDSAIEWLEHEWKINSPNPDETLIESVDTSGEGGQVRLYLRPYQALGGALMPLMDAVIKSVQAAPRDMMAMAAAWDAFETLVEGDPGLQSIFSLREVQLFGRFYGEQFWANVQHSPQYINSYRPAYRVLTHVEAQLLLESQQILMNQR